MLTPPEGFDWYSDNTEPHTCPPMLVWVERSGVHEWRFETVDTRGLDYWMCLERFQVAAVDSRTGELVARRDSSRKSGSFAAAAVLMLGSVLSFPHRQTRLRPGQMGFWRLEETLR